MLIYYQMMYLYIPQRIIYYDKITNEEIILEVRDLLENSLITDVFFEELG